MKEAGSNFFQGKKRMPAYVPPHLRKKIDQPTAAVALSKKGVKFPSNATGDPNANVKFKKAPTKYRNNNLTRAQKYTAISKKLGTRKLRNKPVKTLLRGKTAKVRPSSAPALL